MRIIYIEVDLENIILKKKIKEILIEVKEILIKVNKLFLFFKF
jgi:hypothetical protein